MNEPKKPQRGRIPNFVAVILLVGVTCGGGAMIWWWMHRDGIAPDVIVLDQNPMGIRKAQRLGQVAKDNTGIRAVAGGVEVRLTPAATDKKSELHLRALNTDSIVTPQQTQVLRATRQLANAAGLAKRLNVTPEQAQKLKQVAFDLELKITDRDRTRLEAMCAQWDKAQGEAKTTAETNLFAAMREIGPAAVQSTRQLLARNTDQAKLILTAQQWQQYQQFINDKTAAKAAPAAGKPVQAPQPAPAAKKPADKA